MSDLKPCPFCGGEAMIIHSILDACFITCENNDCMAGQKVYSTKAEAIAAWNARTERTCMLIRHGSLANMPSFVCWSCSECGFGWHHSEYDKQFSFCPNCGAKVVGE